MEGGHDVQRADASSLDRVTAVVGATYTYSSNCVLTLERRSARGEAGIARAPREPLVGSVSLRDLQDLLAGVGGDQVGVVGGDVRLNLLHQFVLALGFDGRATCAVDLHQCPLRVVDATTLCLSRVGC